MVASGGPRKATDKVLQVEQLRQGDHLPDGGCPEKHPGICEQYVEVTLSDLGCAIATMLAHRFDGGYLRAQVAEHSPLAPGGLR